MPQPGYREITEDEYQFLQGKRRTADFSESVWNHPRANKPLKKIVKDIYPDLPIADYDLEMQVNSRLDAEKAERERQEQEAKNKAADEKWRNERKRVQDEYSFTDEGMTDLEKFMHEKGVGDYEVAAGYRAAKNPKTSEPTYQSSHWNYEKRPEWGQIGKDPERWAEEELTRLYHEDAARNRGR
jgi:hypothetical protein